MKEIKCKMSVLTIIAVVIFAAAMSCCMTRAAASSISALPVTATVQDWEGNVESRGAAVFGNITEHDSAMMIDGSVNHVKIYSVTAPKDGYMVFTASCRNDTKYFNTYISKDPDSFADGDEDSVPMINYAKKGETIYLAVCSVERSFDYYYLVKAKLISAPTKAEMSSIKEDTGYEYGITKGSYVFGFTATKTGELSLKASDLDDDEADSEDTVANAMLLNANRKPISVKQPFDSRGASFGVVKGRRYFIKLYFSKECKGHLLSFSIHNTAYRAGSVVKAKASALKGTVTSFLTTGAAKAQWYKLIIKKSGSHVIRLYTCTSGRFYAAVYNGNRKLSLKHVDKKGSGNGRENLYKGKLRKGTYFIKVYKTKKTATGIYYLSCK